MRGDPILPVFATFNFFRCRILDYPLFIKQKRTKFANKKEKYDEKVYDVGSRHPANGSDCRMHV